MEELQTLAASEKTWVAQRAAMAIHLQESYLQGNISAAECRRLLQTMIKADILDKEADDDEAKADLIESIYNLSTTI
jgi:hypothetical protein